MDACTFCGCKGGKHAPACPKATGKSGDFGIWRAGYNAGRGGKPATSEDPTFLLGYHQGEIALEEALNGC